MWDELHRRTVDRLIADCRAATDGVRNARSTLPDRIRDIEAELSRDLPTSLTAAGVQAAVHDFESRVFPGIRQRIVQHQRAIERVDVYLQRWDMQHRHSLDRIQRLGMAIQRRSATMQADSAAAESARERLRRVEEQLQRLQYRIPEIKHARDAYLSELRALESDVHPAIDRLIAFVRQRGPIARA